MATTALERLLFLQGGLCFFCKAPLPRAEASIEHLQATAHGGTNHDANRVACCKTLNRVLGGMPLKDKIEVVLRQKGGFVCPNGAATRAPERTAPSAPVAMPTPSPTPTPTPMSMPMPVSGDAALRRVLDDLKRRGTARPRKDTTLRSTLEAFCTQQKLGCTVDEILHLLVNGGTVIVDESGKVTYRF